MFEILVLFVTLIPVIINTQSCPRCSNEDKKVCTIDENHNGPNKTFMNPCLAATENCGSDKNYTVIHEGRCQEEDCQPICFTIYSPICATSNDNTFRNFSNECEYNLANCIFTYNKSWSISSKSNCPDNVCPDCSNNYPYEPVCYSYSKNTDCTPQNITYLNGCKAKQAMYCQTFNSYNSEQPSWTKISDGPCYERKICPKCAETSGEDLCAFNGVSFRNFMNSCAIKGYNECARPESENRYYEAYKGICDQNCISQSES